MYKIKRKNIVNLHPYIHFQYYGLIKNEIIDNISQLKMLCKHKL